MVFHKKKELNSLKETKEFAKELSQRFKNGDIVILNGELGSGKTTLIKFITDYYGIDNTTSPSFSIVNEYVGEKKVYHFDFYRLKKVDELYDIGFEDYLNDSEAIIFIEWGYLMKEIIPSEHYEILIEYVGGEKRVISLKEHKK